MENKIACINNGVVENIIICSDAFAKTLGYDQTVNVTNLNVPLGSTYANGEFTPPVPVAPEETPVQE